MIFLSLEQFASARRRAQTELEDELRPFVERALDRHTNTRGYRELIAESARVWRSVYAEQATVDHPHGMPGDFRRLIENTLRQTDRHKITEHTADRITIWLATAILNNATVAAAHDVPEDLLMEWVTMHDSKVRHAHRQVEGQRRAPGVPFRVDDHDMMAPGDPSAPIELWINCRCSLRPVLAEALVASDNPSDTSKMSVIVALPAADDAVHSIGEEQKHITLAFLGEFNGDVGTVHDAVAGVGGSMEPFSADVSGTASLGPDHAKVWLVEAGAIATLRQRLLDNPTISDGVAAADSHPHFVPHVTMGYDENMPPEATDVSQITFDRLAVWHGSDQTEYPLGEAMTEKAPEAPAEETPTEDQTPATAGLVPWHGVLAPEDIASGDGRKFAAGSLRVRPLPLPLTWQKTSDDGHKGNVTVAKINRIERVGSEMRADGYMLAIPEADEVIFTDARIASACIVPIPAFAEAWVSLGEAPSDFFGSDAVEAPADATLPEEEEALVAGRGPGWVTDPVATKRIHDYWTKPGEEGYDKIGWGVPGDFNRCRVEVGEEIGENSPDKVRFLNQICAQWHHDALGFWPGRAPSEQASLDLKHTAPAEALTLVAGGGKVAPSEWFQNPMLEGPTPVTITEEGRVFGHIAAWNTCHSGFADQCITAPKSPSNYAHFLLGEVLTDKGGVPCGSLTIGGGHAGPRLSMRAAMAHYDNSTAAWADVTVGEDEHGIWFAGWVRPGTSDDMIAAARASKLSGDWRNSPHGLDMIAALAVNVPGFEIPRIAAAVEGTVQLSLVAAGVVASEVEGPKEVDIQALAAAVAKEIMATQTRKERMAALAARYEGGQ